MAMVINSNIQSLNAQRHLNNSLSAQNTATERLSSGLRINSAKDDAAGLAIANRMTSQVKGLDMAIRNANDGVSLIQTAEGALSQTTNILQRMRELSIQSANGIYDSGNRGTLNAEVQQLKSEIDRIAESTTFNGLNILDGSLGSVGLQIGEKANQTIEVDIQKMDTKTLGMGSTSVDVLGAAAKIALFTGADSLEHGDLLINGQSLMKINESFDLGASTTPTQQDLIDKINTNVNGVTASTVTTTQATQVGSGVIGSTAFAAAVADLDGSITTIQVVNTESLQELADKLNDQSNGLISATINDKGYLSISSENSASITISGSTATTTGIASAAYQTSLALSSDNGDPITIERGTSGNQKDLDALGFRESNVAGTIEGVQVDSNAFVAGDFSINGVGIGKTDDADLQSKIDAINKVSGDTGVNAIAFSSATLDFSGVGDLDGGDIAVNGVTMTVANDDVDKFVVDFNALTPNTGITATKLGDSVILEGNVASINLSIDDSGTAVEDVFTDGTEFVGFDAALTGITTGAGGTDIGAAVSAAGGIKLVSENGNPISVDHKDAAAATKTGLINANSAGDGKFGAAVNSLDITTAAGANKAIDILDTAIQTVSDVRGDLGAVNNRLDYTVQNLANVSENASAAKSRIMDADFAAESANLSRAQVLQQAGNAMLAQANSRPQQVLSLLQ